MDWESETKRWHDKALEDLKSCGNIPFMLRIYPLETDNCAVWVEPDGLDDEGRKKLLVISSLCRESPPAAILLQSDTWQASETFFRHYGMETLPTKKREERYVEILNREYGGTLANVPQELKGEAIITCTKGPKLLPSHHLTFYRREKGHVVVEKTLDLEGRAGTLNLLPDWWESQVQ